MMKIIRCLLVLIATCSVELHADLLSETKKVLDFFDRGMEKTLPSNSEEFGKHEDLKSSSGLSITLDELRACFSVLHSKLEVSATSAKDVFVQNLQKSMSQVFHKHIPQEFATKAAEFGTTTLHGVSLSDFLRPYESMGVGDLKARTKFLLEQILSTFLNNQGFHDFYKFIGIDTNFYETIVLLQSISSEK
ncbi:hypothetical protein [Endozoicomonas sp. ALD040]|uniref:hypothetical protein n=1 Tax=unclassified Endozoicomonas TaxID=2644528 RepID=UPI003BB07781